ncbi:sulfite exporter TauE/SafE family protein [Mumia sp. DW29H23]|uniref:sulfite exporter TauE/SafE family protein n=1 Tax=Mumia sp. DW29H23 TaxID=3421241 RepID=UPI003D685ADB
MSEILTFGALSILAVSFGVGIVVGLTGMGGGALMTPALIFLGINPTAAVANDLVAASVNKSVGAAVHAREGSPNWRLAGWLMLGSIPTAAAGAFIIEAIGGADDQTAFVKTAIGGALILTAATYTLRSFLNVRAARLGRPMTTDDPAVRPLPTFLVGAVGGLLVGVTSVGSGSLIMVSLLLLYPTLTAVRLVGTDLVQAVPLVLSAAITHVIVTGVDIEVLVPLILGGTPGTYLGARIANRVPQGIVRRGIVVVLTLTGLTLLGVEPVAVGLIAAGMVILGPIAWALLRNRIGVPEGVDLFAEKKDVERARRASEEAR